MKRRIFLAVVLASCLSAQGKDDDTEEDYEPTSGWTWLGLGLVVSVPAFFVVRVVFEEFVPIEWRKRLPGYKEPKPPSYAVDEGDLWIDKDPILFAEEESKPGRNEEEPDSAH